MQRNMSPNLTRIVEVVAYLMSRTYLGTGLATSKAALAVDMVFHLEIYKSAK